MKKHLTALLIALFVIVGESFSQSVGINSNGSAPDGSAMLDVNSTSKGFLPPRMTTSERNAIAHPAEGLIVYNTSTKRPNYFNGTIWVNYDGTTAMPLGDTCFGGVIVYYFQDGDSRYVPGEVHGIICSTVRFGTYGWGCQGINIGSAGLTCLGCSNLSTDGIVSMCASTAIPAAICDTLTLNGYTDWYLPTREDLSQIIAQKNYIPGFATGVYWSSSQENATRAYAYDYNPGVTEQMISAPKFNSYYFYAVRYF